MVGVFIVNFSKAILVISVAVQASFSFASEKPQEFCFEKEIIDFNRSLSDLILMDDAVNLEKLLNDSGSVPKLTSEITTIALSSAMWEESTNALKVLLGHLKYELPFVLEIYKTANTYFGGPSETKNILKKKIIELGGNDPDELSDDDTL